MRRATAAIRGLSDKIKLAMAIYRGGGDMRRFLVTIAAALVAAGAALPALAASPQEDARVAEQIGAMLRDSGQMKNYSVGVKYSNGTVWLSGRVASQQQMQTALEVISEFEGVRKIVNETAISAGTARVKPPIAAKAPVSPYARRVSAMGTEANQWGATQQPAVPAPRQPIPISGSAVQADGQVMPAGYHRLAANRAARHACPPTMYQPVGGGANPPAYDEPYLPKYAWPSYAAYPNYAALTYPQQYSPTAWPYIGPFYPYPQVPLGWRKVALEWDDGWWFLDFYDRSHH
jgi:BON domain